MKIRYVFVAIVLAVSAACQTSPIAPQAEDSPALNEVPAVFDTNTASSDSTARAGGGWAGSGT